MSFDYYQTHSPFTDPGEYAHLYRDLPQNPAELIEIVQGLLIHKLTARFFQVELSPVQRKEQFLRTIGQRVSAMAESSPEPLIFPRQPAERQVGVCRDFALLFVSLLRHLGIPARMRVGFAPYLDPQGLYRYDHWVSQYWNSPGAIWILADPQIDAVQRDNMAITINTHNLRAGEDFIFAGNAWAQCRSGSDKSLIYRFNGNWKGMPCIRGNLLHDFQTLNKVELTPGIILTD